MSEGTGIAAVLTGVAGVITAWAAVVRARNQGREHCREELDAARTEAEQLADEVHALRMHGDAGEVSVLLLISCVCFAACIVLTALTVRGNAHDGSNGNDGARGPRGEPGASVQGTTGEPGPPGEQGVPGPPGAPGRDGANGNDGAPGVGMPGATGATGAQGAPGVQGVPGPTTPSTVPTTLQCPEGFTPEVIDVHERVPTDINRTVMVCAATVPP